MYTPTQQEALNKLKKYLSETDPLILAAEVERISAMEFEGLTLDEYFNGFAPVSPTLIHLELNVNTFQKTIKKQPKKFNNDYACA
jgi:hypothetical protein